MDPAPPHRVRIAPHLQLEATCAALLTFAHGGGGAGGVATLRATTAHCQLPLRIRRRDPSSATAEPAAPPATPDRPTPALPSLLTPATSTLPDLTPLD